ncbi:MAG: ATP-binding protein, partial [Lachnospiraceae bacterium]|nr:ATP-binding protein [Lachnospiraceae bacterium]
RKNRIKFLERKNTVLEENYHLLTDLYRKNEHLYHDMNHHLQMIYHLAKKNGISEIAEYISAISAPIDELSDTTWSGVDIVDAILNHTLLEAQKQGIEIDVNAEFPKDCNITSDDLCVILFNLLDNAAEACLRYMNQTGNPPHMEVTLRRIHQFLIIKIKNPCVPPRKLFGIFPTTKADTRHHGIGLRNVREKVEKYNGSLEIEVEGDVFTVTALLFFE